MITGDLTSYFSERRELIVRAVQGRIIRERLECPPESARFNFCAWQITPPDVDADEESILKFMFDYQRRDQ